MPATPTAAMRPTRRALSAHPSRIAFKRITHDYSRALQRLQQQPDLPPTSFTERPGRASCIPVRFGYPIAAALLICTAGKAGSEELWSNVLLNPGFEQGSGGTQITGWVRFNNAYRSDGAAHAGQYSLVAWGNWWPSNEWNASGAYQEHPVAPGQIWEASCWLYASSNLQGQAYAAVNLEYYSADTVLLARASSAVKLRSDSPTGQWIHASVKRKAVKGAAFARIVPLFVQSPDFESGFAYFDDCALYLVPTTTIEWAGYRWEVGDGHNDPGPNYFSTNCVSVDQDGRLHLQIVYSNNIWWCAGVENLESLGFGRYLWHLDSPVDQLGTSVVGALFVYAPPEVWGTNENELDIEFTHAWMESSVTSVTYTVQPYTIAGNARSFYMVLTNSPTTHEIDWQPDRVRFRSWFGHSTSPPPDAVIADWFFVTRGIPIESGERPMMNIWLYEGRTPSATTETLEMVVSDFHFEPFRGFLLADDFTDPSTAAVWQVIRGGSPPADVYEADGALHICPVAYGPPAGYASVYAYRRNERGCRYVLKGTVRSIEVNQSLDGDELYLFASLSTETNNPLHAPAAAMLKAAYDKESDRLLVYFNVKAESPMSEGTNLFRGAISNFTGLLSQQPVELRMSLEPSNYWIHARGARDGTWLPLQTEAGSPSGSLGLDEKLTNCFAFFGAQCNSGATGQVEWDDVALGISSQQLESFTVSCAPCELPALELSWPGAFDARHAVLRSDTVTGPWQPVHTNLPSLMPQVTCTVTADGARGFFQVRTRPF